jgi:hypothetical protein
MTLNQAEFVRQERILKCPECREEFNVNDIDSGTVEMTSGKWIHTISECPSCHEIISIGCKELK